MESVSSLPWNTHSPQEFVSDAAREREARAAGEDSALLRTLGLAHHWQRLLDEGRFSSMTEIAAVEGIDLGQASKMSRLAQLAPDLIEALALGHLEVGVSQLLRGKVSSFLAGATGGVGGRVALISVPHQDAAARRLFLCLSLVRSRSPEQAKKQTDSLQTRMNTGLQLLNVQEGSREQREKSGRMHAWNDDFGRAVLKRARLGAAPILALRPKKNPSG
ncbi:MAG: hypothetical protein V5B34_15255 [Accumulibacter sp.]